MAKKKKTLNTGMCAEKLRALADPDRLRIVRALGRGALSVSDLAAEMKSPLVNVSHHLSVLRHARLVVNRKDGRKVMYSLAPSVQGDDLDSANLNLGCCQLVMPAFAEEPAAKPPDE